MTMLSRMIDTLDDRVSHRSREIDENSIVSAAGDDFDYYLRLAQMGHHRQTETAAAPVGRPMMFDRQSPSPPLGGQFGPGPAAASGPGGAPVVSIRARSAGAANGDKTRSYPITAKQTGTLIPALSGDMAKVLRRVAENYSPETGRGEIYWADVQELCGVKDYDGFARGHLSRLTRHLRNIAGNSAAVLLVGDDSWDWVNGVNDDAAYKFYIDGPAILALRDYFAAHHELTDHSAVAKAIAA
jgi:hypothetical protein